MTLEEIKFIEACRDAGIRDPEKFEESKRACVFDYLLGAFPDNILPTDIDGHIERHDCHLIIEVKHEKVLRVAIPEKGQKYALQSFVKSWRFTVLYIGVNDDGEPTCFQLLIHNKGYKPLKEANAEYIRDYCSRWWAWAEKQERLQ